MIEFKNNFSLFLLQILIVHAVNSFAYTPCEDCTDRANVSELAKIELRLYPSDDIDVHLDVLIEDAAQLYNYIDNDKPTVIYISGWTESPDSDSVVSIVGAYMERLDHNILVVDYNEIAAGEWDYVVLSADGVGYTLAKAIDELVAAGLDSTKIHVVGHSLGGQISGYIGRYASFAIPRITGLDPAGPQFSLTDDHLSASDAQFVDVIHTNPGGLGTDYSAATVDSFPNRGHYQPGCESTWQILAASCSHARSWAYYVESLLNEEAFLGVECDSYTSFEAGSCSSGTTLVMGFATPTTASGEFYLQTNSASPFGKEESGTTYEE